MVDKKSKKNKGVEKTTMSKLGANLPLGVLDTAGALCTPFSVKPWRMKEEKELGKLRSEVKGRVSVAQQVTLVVSHMLNSVGNHDFTKLEQPEKHLVISQMFMGDVWYVYAYIRKQCIGEEIPMKLNCPRCGKEFDYQANLQTLQVNRSSSLEATKWDYELKNELEIRSKSVKKFVLGPQRWEIAEKSYATNDDSVAKELALIGSIKGLNDDEAQIELIPGELDEMSKVDVETLINRIDLNYMGPNMAIEMTKDDKCPHCQYSSEYLISLDWSYNNFFGISSR